MEKSKHFTEDTLQGSRADYIDAYSQTDSHFSDYEEYLGIDLENMTGQKVLDIGGAPGGSFAKAAKRNNIDLVTMNANIDQFKGYDKDLTRDSHVVVGFAQTLPFADKSFDKTLAFASVPAYLPKVRSEYEAALNEMLRVTKPDGEVRIYPILGSWLEAEDFQNLISDLEKFTTVEMKYTNSQYVNMDIERMHQMIIVKKKHHE